MFKNVISLFATFTLSIFLSTSSFAADEPSMHEVYLAADAGKFSEAEAMMDKVLQDHPNSAKAHFVKAELKAKQGLLTDAKTELNKAESLQPGLAFVKPETLQHLITQLSANTATVVGTTHVEQNFTSAAKEWLPALGLFIGLLLIVLLISFLTRRNKPGLPTNYPNNYSSNTPHPNGTTPYGNNNMGGNMMNQPMGGQSSGLMGSLATGAALGAGVAAGEALIHHFLDSDGRPVQHTDNFNNPPVDNNAWNDNNDNQSINNDMGGNDFGIADNSSWDDDSFSDDGGGDDWT